MLRTQDVCVDQSLSLIQNPDTFLYFVASSSSTLCYMLGPFKYSPLPLLNDMPVKKTILKKPAAAPPKKRPASAPATSLNEKVSAWKKGLSKSDTEDEDNDDEVTDEARDKGKGQKFAKIKGELPAHIIDLYENEAKKQASPREFRSMIINKLFTKLPNGHYALNAKDPMFEEHRQIVDKKFGIDEHMALPRSIMKGKYFNGSNQALDEAVADGSLKRTVIDGEEFFAFRIIRAGIEKSGTLTQTITKKKSITNDQYALMSQTISSLGWSFDFSAKVPLKALENGKITEEMASVLGQAKESNDKLHKEALKIVAKLGPDNKHFGPLKKGITTMDKNLNSLGHVLTWKELPEEIPITKDKFDKFIFMIAESTEQMNELVMTTKAALKSKTV